MALSLRAGGARAASAILDGNIRQVAVSADRVAALRGAELVWLTATGQRLGRPLRPGDALPRAAPKRRLSADDLVDLQGIPDDDLESDPVREALEDEGRGSASGTRHHAPSPGSRRDNDAQRRTPRALAASDEAIWIATPGGLLRLATAIRPAAAEAPAMAARASDGRASDGLASDGLASMTGAPPGGTGAVPVGHPGLALTALVAAPTGDSLAALAGNTVLRSDDGGRSWAVLAVPPTRVRALAISAEGAEVYVQDDEGVAIVTHHQRLPVFEGRVHHVAQCGDELLILSDDGLFAWRWDRGLQQRAGRLPAHQVACSPALSGAVAAIGADLLSSFDGGRTWTRRTDLPVLEIQSVAFGSDRLFVATTSGLFLIPLTPPAPAPVSDDDGSDGRDGDGDSGARRAVRAALAGGGVNKASVAGDSGFWGARPPLWHALLPRVSLVVSAASSHSSGHPGGTRSAIWLLLTLPLGRARPPDGGDRFAAGDVLRRRAEDAGTLARLAPAARRDDEAAALMRVVQEDLEALR